VIDTALAGLQRIFSRDFVLATFLPILLFAGLTGWLLAVVSGRGTAGWRAIEKMPAITQGLLFAAAIAVVAAVAYVVAALQFSLVRVVEGYWPAVGPLRRLRSWLVARQRKRRDRLSRAEHRAVAEGRAGERNSIQLLLAQRYPPPTRLDLMMPTRLGNILRAAEIYPYERYGLDTVVIWPRLRPFLPDATGAALAEDRAAVDALLLLGLLGAVFGTAWPVALLVIGGHVPLVVLTLLGWPLTMLAYRSAQASAVAYGERIRTAFDLYRHALLRHLAIPVPRSVAEERPVWDDLAQFYLRNLPLDVAAKPDPQRSPPMAELDESPVKP